MSFDLKAPNHNSIGAVSYECGPVKQIGIFNLFNILIVLVPTWYGALSNRIMWVSLQFFCSLSSKFTRDKKNISIVFWLLLLYNKLKYTLPFVSSPTIMEIRGDIISWATELVDLCTCHFLLLKSVIFNHDSSTFSMTFPSRRARMYFSANYWRQTRFFSLLVRMEIGITFLYLIPISCLITERISLRFVYIWSHRSRFLRTLWAESMKVSYSFMDSTTRLILYLLLFTESRSEMISYRYVGFF